MEEKKKGRFLSRFRENPWIISTFLLLLFSVLVLVTNSSVPKTGYLIDELEDASRFYDGNLIGVSTYIPELVVYDRLSCYKCNEFYTQVLPDLLKNDIQYGDLRVIFHDVPDFSDPVALDKSKALRCALKENKYFEFRFALSQENVPKDFEFYKTIAKELGIKRFDQCFSSHDTFNALLEEYRDAEEQGITEFPSFFINGKAVAFSSLTYDSFKKVLKREL